MKAPSIESRPASPIQPHEEAPVSRASTATKPLAEKASRGQPAGVLSNLASRPKRTDIQSNQARLGTLQRLNDSKLLNDIGHYEKAAPIAKQIRAQLPAYENALGEQVVAGEIAAEEGLELMSSMTASLKNVEGIGSKIADIDAGGQGLAQQVGNLLRALAPDLADRATPERVESLGREGPRAGAARPLPPIPTGPRPEGPRSSTQSPAAMSPLQARIVNAQLAGQPVTSRKLEQANDAALAAALQESLDSPAHDGATSSMSPHQAGVVNSLEAGHDVDADALQIADDEALAMAIAQSLDEEQGAQPAQHPATHAALTPESRPELRPKSRPQHAPSEAPPHDAAAQMKSMQAFQSHQMAITHAQHEMQAKTKGAEAMVQLTSHN